MLEKGPCENVISCIDVVINHLNSAVKCLNQNDIEKMIYNIQNANRIFVMGAGRSGLVARAFAMRLMHIGFSVFVVGEATTPSVKNDDLLIAVSGSGETLSINDLAKVSKDIGSNLAVISSNPKSTLGKMADTLVVVKGRTKIDTGDEEGEDYLERQLRGDYVSLAPLGTMFEITSLIVLDAIIAELISRRGTTDAEIKDRHAQLE